MFVGWLLNVPATCHTETEVADQTFHLTQSQYTDTRPTSPSIDPGAWHGSHWSANFLVTGMTRPRLKKKNPGASGIRTRDLPLSRRTPQSLGQRGGKRHRVDCPWLKARVKPPGLTALGRGKDGPLLYTRKQKSFAEAKRRRSSAEAGWC